MKKAALKVLLVLLVLALLPTMAMAAEVTTLNGFKTAIANGGTIELGDDIVVTEAVTFNKETTINLNGHKLHFKQQVGSNNVKANVTINGEGTVDVTGAKAAAANAIIYVCNGATFKLANQVKLHGDGYNSAFAVIYADASHAVIVDSEIELKNEKDTGSGGALKTGGSNSSIYIKNTKITLDNAARGLVSQGALTQTITLEDCSDVVIENMKHAFTNTGTLNIINSNVKMQDLSGHGIGMNDKDAKLNITKGSEVTTVGAEDGGLEFEGEFAEDSVLVDNTSSFAVEKATYNGADLTVEKFIKAMNWKEGVVVYNDNGEFVIQGENFSVVPAAPTYSAPKTGDNSQLLLWAGMMIVAVIGMVAFGKKRAATDR